MQVLSAVYADRSASGAFFDRIRSGITKKATPLEELLFYNLLYFISFVFQIIFLLDINMIWSISYDLL